MNRRGFLRGFLGVAVAPAVVRAESLMPIYVPPAPILWGDGWHDDTEALQALFAGRKIVDKWQHVTIHRFADGGLDVRVHPGCYVLSDTLNFPRDRAITLDNLHIDGSRIPAGKPILYLPANTHPRSEIISNYFQGNPEGYGVRMEPPSTPVEQVLDRMYQTQRELAQKPARQTPKLLTSLLRRVWETTA